jgi:hypothetical protein
VGSSAPNVAQNALDNGEVALPRVMHVQACLLDGVGDVRPCNGEVLAYCSALVILQYSLGSKTVAIEEEGSLTFVSIGVATGLQCSTLARSSNSSAYFVYDRKKTKP